MIISLVVRRCLVVRACSVVALFGLVVNMNFLGQWSTKSTPGPRYAHALALVAVPMPRRRLPTPFNGRVGRFQPFGIASSRGTRNYEYGCQSVRWFAMSSLSSGCSQNDRRNTTFRTMTKLGHDCRPDTLVRTTSNQVPEDEHVNVHDVLVPLVPVVRLKVTTPEEMEEVGAILSEECARGDVLLLGGDLGAGKTCFSRGFVRCLTGDPDLRVTSPTYLLSNTYPIYLFDDNDDDKDVHEDHGDDDDDVTPSNIDTSTSSSVHHMDLYRLKGGEDNKSEFQSLNLDHVFTSCEY
jgi:tRNA A37 threonylcarbamoyladenosine biosynthesis protein TsaE